MYRLILTEGKEVTTMTFCDRHGLEVYLDENDLPVLCDASLKELTINRKLPTVVVGGKILTITCGV